jgi:hypothetical protein
VDERRRQTDTDDRGIDRKMKSQNRRQESEDRSQESEYRGGSCTGDVLRRMTLSPSVILVSVFTGFAVWCSILAIGCWTSGNPYGFDAGTAVWALTWFPLTTGAVLFVWILPFQPSSGSPCVIALLTICTITQWIVWARLVVWFGIRILHLAEPVSDTWVT